MPHQASARNIGVVRYDGCVSERAKRVLMISAAYPPMVSGEATQALFVCRQLVQAGWHVDLLTTDRPSTPTSEPFQVHAVMGDWGWRDWGKAKKVLREVSPEVVLILYTGWLYGHQPMVTFLPMWLRRSMPTTRIVSIITHPDGSRESKLTAASRWLHRLLRVTMKPRVSYNFGTLLSDSHAVVALAEHFQPRLEEMDATVGRRLVVIPPAALLRFHEMNPPEARSEGRKLLHLQTGDQLAVYTGLIAPGKGLETLLKALAILQPTHPQLHLALVGGVVNEHLPHHQQFAIELEAMIDQLGLRNKVHKVGPFEVEDLEPSLVLAAGDVAVLPWDGGVHMNNSTVATVSAHGLPIVTTRPTELESIFLEGDNVLLCASKDAGAMALAIQQVLHVPRVRQRLMEGSAKLQREHMGWPMVMQRLEAVMRG